MKNLFYFNAIFILNRIDFNSLVLEIDPDTLLISVRICPVYRVSIVQFVRRTSPGVRTRFSFLFAASENKYGEKNGHECFFHVFNFRRIKLEPSSPAIYNIHTFCIPAVSKVGVPVVILIPPGIGAAANISHTAKATKRLRWISDSRLYLHGLISERILHGDIL
jgi:hypothetical protein